MVESESALLRRFIEAHDGGAFAEIVRRHAGPVYGTCLRVLADTDQAADATQETFFQLVKKAGHVRGSLGGWLHRVATRKALDVIRADSARRRREDRWADGGSVAERTWREVAPYVDEALDSLDDPTRELLIRHYLDGGSMTELAEESGVSRQTIARQIDAGLVRLRAYLGRRGVLVAAATLSVLLTENTARSAPLALLPQLSKMALVGGTVAGAASTSAGSGLHTVVTDVLAIVQTKAVVVGVVAAIGVGSALTYYEVTESFRKPDVRTPVESATAYPSRGTARAPGNSRKPPAPPNNLLQTATRRAQPGAVAGSPTDPPDSEPPVTLLPAIHRSGDEAEPTSPAIGYGPVGGYSGGTDAAVKAQEDAPKQPSGQTEGFYYSYAGPDGAHYDARSNSGSDPNQPDDTGSRDPNDADGS